ncbi:hypothetical protein PBY51_024103 [Eleginops maclovinus]|uniref:Uncharacterized protein n=1 Tax=Eleginops maclovinus TaxID=56733 RepID=A0AAN7Y0A9_ELEMC|nr:hypothetical protein PBY51_024103 [Eleginops maclovinus]
MTIICSKLLQRNRGFVIPQAKPASASTRTLNVGRRCDGRQHRWTETMQTTVPTMDIRSKVPVTMVMVNTGRSPQDDVIDDQRLRWPSGCQAASLAAAIIVQRCGWSL